MKKLFTAVLSVIFLSSLLLSGCSGAPTATVSGTAVPEPPAPSETAVVTSEPTPQPIACTIAFDSDRDGNREVYTMDSEGNNLVNLTANDGQDFDPAWSPDGTQIAFVSDRVNESEGGQFIYLMNADGSDVRQLTSEKDSDFPDWSPDGNAITYTAYGDIYVIKTDGSAASVNLTNSEQKDWKSVWSMDGSQIAWLSGKDDGWNVFVMNADGSNPLQLTDNGTATDVAWTVQGQLFTHYNAADNLCLNCLINRDGSNLSAAGGKGEIQKYIPYFTLAGDRVELVSGDVNTNDNEILLVGEIFPDIFKNITNNPANDVNPSWPLNCGPVYGAAGNAQVVDKGSTGQDTADIVIGYTGERNPMEETDLQKACSELDVQCKEGSDITALVEQQVDAIVYFSNRWNVLGDSSKIHDAALKRIPLIVLNAESEETNEPGVYNLSIDSDSVAKTLEWMFEGMGGSGKLMYVNVGHSNFHQSLIDQALKAHPGITGLPILAEYDGVAMQNENILSLIKENPDAGAIWADEFIPNLFWSVSGLQSDHLPLIPCEPKAEILTAWKDKLDNNIPLQCFSTIKPGGTGYEGVYVAWYLATGAQIDPEALGGVYGNTLIYDYPIITNDSLSEWIAKSDGFRTGDGGLLQLAPMTPEQIKETWFLE